MAVAGAGRGARRAAGALALAALLAACGGGDGAPVAGPSASGSPSGAPTAAPTVVPTPTTAVPTPTRTRTPRATRTPRPAPPPAPPPSAVPLACAGQDVEVLPTSARRVAVTVDLGGDSAGLPAILRALADADVRATFFVTGAFVRRDPDGLRRIAAAGHVVGNHTDTHPELPTLGDAAVRAQLAAVEDAVRAVTGRTTRPLFRFPFGARDARTIRLVNDGGWCAYRWTVDTLGWKGTSGGSSAEAVLDRVVRALRPGAIVLMHGGANPDDGSTLDADALPSVLQAVRERGYGFTTLPRG